MPVDCSGNGGSWLSPLSEDSEAGGGGRLWDWLEELSGLLDADDDSSREEEDPEEEEGEALEGLGIKSDGPEETELPEEEAGVPAGTQAAARENSIAITRTQAILFFIT